MAPPAPVHLPRTVPESWPTAVADSGGQQPRVTGIQAPIGRARKGRRGSQTGKGGVSTPVGRFADRIEEGRNDRKGSGNRSMKSRMSA